MIRLAGVELRRGGAKVLDRADLVVQRHQKVGVVGANGAGKTSLFGLLLGELEPDRGDVGLPAGVVAATVAQEAPAGDAALVDYVASGDPRIASIRTRLGIAEARGDAGGQAAAHAELETIHGYAAQADASRILRGLGFVPGDESRALDTLSGGWRMRAALARTLAARSELLLLDEPTNHLDLDAVVWLEAWLRRYPGTLLLISHDREFLDPIVDHVALVRDARIQLYTGSYSAFERLRAAEVEHSRRTAARLHRERARVRSFVDRFRYKASKARQAQSRLKALERMQVVEPLGAQRRFAFEFFEPEHLPRPVATLDSVSIGYDARTVLGGVSMALAPGDRIALLGANGMGKSTLLRGLAGRLAPMDGTIEHSPRARVGYFAQHRVEQLDLHRTPLDQVRGVAPDMREQEMRDFLGGFGFGHAAAARRAAPLSGGEKTRLALALLVLERPNLLLLDEPTNHLDLDMREALAASLQTFSGALVLVSHDRRLLRLVCDSLWIAADGRAAPFEGDIDDYTRWLADRRATPAPGEPQPADAKTTDARRERRRRFAAARRMAAPLRRDIEALEQRLGALGEERASIESALADAAIYRESERVRLRDLLVRRGKLDEETAAAESAWIEKHEQLEAMDGPGADSLKVDSPGVDGLGVDGPGVDGPGVDGPGVDGPGVDGPGVDGPGVDSPGVDGPGVDGPGVDGPGVDGPGVDGPGTSASGGVQ